MFDHHVDKPQATQTLRDILAIFFFKKHVFLVTFVSVVFIAVLLVFLFPPIYVVSARLVVKNKIESPMIFDKESSRLNIDNRVNTQMINTVMQLIQSPALLRTVVLNHGSAGTDEKAIQTAVNSFRGRISVEPLALSNMLLVTLKGGDPETLHVQLNQILDTYILYHIEINQTEKGSLRFFSRQTESYAQKFAQLTDELAQLSGEKMVAHPELQKEHILKYIKDLNNIKSKAVIDLNNLVHTIRQLKLASKSGYSSNSLVTLPVNIMERFPALEEMEKSLTQLLINRQRAYNDYLPGTKSVHDADTHYNNMLGQISIHIDRLLTTLSANLQIKRNELNDLSSQIVEAEAQLKEITVNAIVLQRLELEQTMAKEKYALYNVKREEARINNEKDNELFANISIAARPVQPFSPWFPNKKKILVIAVFLAFVLALGTSAGMYAFDQRVLTPYDIINKTDIRFLGSLDEMSQGI